MAVGPPIFDCDVPACNEPRFGQALGQAADAADDTLQARTFLAEFLRTLRIVPDVRIFEFTGDFFEPLGLGLEVKDTP